jgi:hypothetical protein
MRLSGALRHLHATSEHLWDDEDTPAECAAGVGPVRPECSLGGMLEVLTLLLKNGSGC